MTIPSIITLNQFPLPTLIATFLESFEDYPISMNQLDHEERWERLGIDLSLSYGVMKDGQLMGLMIHSPLEEDIFNFGTGLVPRARHQGLLDKMYEQALPDWKAAGFLTTSLEVISDNLKAVKAYERNGFKSGRTLHSFQGTLQIPDRPRKALYSVVEPLTFPFESSHWGAESRLSLVKRKPLHYELHLLKENGLITASALFNPLTLTLYKVDFKQEGNLDELLIQMKLQNEKIRVLNMPEELKNLTAFFESRKLTKFVSQCEMKLVL